MSRRKKWIQSLLLITWTGPASIPLFAQDLSNEFPDAAQYVTVEQDVVSYRAGFFSGYRPDSALDMLNQLPGFRMNFGGELRGYGSDTGNVLIDGRRPSSKRLTVPSILDRIPASQVDRIELIRGPVRNIELLGEPVVANVILLTDVPAAVRWATTGYRNMDADPMPWSANVALSDRWASIDYNAGLDLFRVVYSDRLNEDVFDGDGDPAEHRFEEGYEEEFEGNFDLTASTWLGETLLTWNSQIGIQDGGEEFMSLRTPQGAGTSTETISSVTDELQIEAGITAEHNLLSDLSGNVLLYVSREDEDTITTQTSLNPFGVQTVERLRDTNQIEKEGIVRTEFEWTRFSDHTVRLNLEGSYNRVANTEVQTLDTGTGPVTEFVPGANTAIKEYRGDFLLKDTWSMGRYELDYGMGAEISRLTQRGDADVERNLSFLKPHAELSYTPSDLQKFRLRLAREVAQLVFQEFISASLLRDDDVVIANPDLKPETTWKSELGYEQRFGKVNVFKLTLFHHWISDVQDLLPISASEEAPGNIGDGRRWGVEFQSTIRLDEMGLENARFDINARWQDSSVTDPVTGEDRVLTASVIPDSNSSRSIFETDNEYVLVVDFRQDFEESRVAWGWDVTMEGDFPVYKVNEFDYREKGADLNLFIETTRWLGVKFRMEFNNVLDLNKSRARTIYTGERDLSPVQRTLIQDRTDGRVVGLSLSGSF